MTTNNLFANRATAKLAVDLEPVDTAITLETGTGVWFPAPGANQFFRLVVQKGSAQTDQREYMRCTSRAGDVLTVERAQEGTPAAEFKVGDEASLVVTALSLDGLVQRVGPTLQGALEVEAAPTTPLGIATKQFVEDVAIDDAPADGKDYARKDAVWHALGAAANLPVPIPIGMGGTGGISLSEAQLNLAIATTTFDDVAPVTPRYGDRWIRPSSMTEMVWAPNAGGGGAGVWINPADAASQAYPIPIDKGGTGAITAAQARINLGIEYTTQPFKLFDGTKAAPGLAWNSEPGLGWFRPTASAIHMAAQGATFWVWDAAQTTTYATLYPKAAAGGTQFTLINQQPGVADYNFLTLNQDGNGLGRISTGSAGAAVRGKLQLDTPQVLHNDGTIAAPVFAFVNEAGLGFTRSGPSAINMTAGGFATHVLYAGLVGTSSIGVNPRTNGNTYLALSNQPSGAANVNSLVVQQQGNGGAIISTGATGSAVRGNLTLDAPTVATTGGLVTGSTIQIAAPDPYFILSKAAGAHNNYILGTTNGSARWYIILGNSTAESGGNAGSDFTISRISDAGAWISDPLTINRANGTISLNGNVLLTNGGLEIAAGAMSIKVPGSTYTSTLTQYVPDGRLVLARDNTNWNNGTLQIYADHADITTNVNGASVLSYRPGTIGLNLQGAAQTTGAGATQVMAVWEGDRHSYRVYTGATRFLKDIRPLAGGALEKVLALKPITYVSAIKGDATARGAGFLPEDFHAAGLRDYVVYQDNEVHSLSYDRIPVLLVKAIQELTARVAQLENT